MNADIKYEYKYDNNKYVLYHGKECTLIGNEVAICFHYISSTFFIIHKHGIPEEVEKFYNNIMQSSEEHGINLANSLTIMKGRIPIEELNRIINRRPKSKKRDQV